MAAQQQQRAVVLSSYRRLYRARIYLFRGDTVAMQKSRVAVRDEYTKHGGDPIDDTTQFQELIHMADEAADMLRHSLVRGNLNTTTGHYGTYVYMLLMLVLFWYYVF
jgi:uncharacterized membrane protein affecting hemolysin expression